MQNIFYIDEVKLFLKELNSGVITISKFVEILNEKVSNSDVKKWVGFIEEQPNDGETVIVCYKTFEYSEQKYLSKNKEWFFKNCQCWLKKL